MLFGSAWTPALDAAAKAGLLYVIDFRIYETLQPQKVAGIPRFTPSTVTVLVQNPATKALTPELVRVAGGNNEPKVFSRQGSTTASAWVYALQAAKVSVTVFGVWLGHVYQWHIVTAAMVMTMFDNLSANHPVRKLLEPQSSYVIPFDNVLLLAFELGGPSDVDCDRTTVRRADGSLRRDAPVLRRRSDDHAGAARHRRVRLHRPRAVGPVPQRRPVCWPSGMRPAATSARTSIEPMRPTRTCNGTESSRSGSEIPLTRIAATSAACRSWIRKMP